MKTVKKNIKKIITGLYLSLCMVMCMSVPVFAKKTEAEDGGDGATAEIETAMSGVIDILYTIMTGIGIALGVWGLYELVMSITQDMPEKKVKGIGLLAGGVILVSARVVLGALGVGYGD